MQLKKPQGRRKNKQVSQKMKLKLILHPKIQINIAKSSLKTSRTFEKKNESS